MWIKLLVIDFFTFMFNKCQICHELGDLKKRMEDQEIWSAPQRLADKPLEKLV